MRQETLHTWLGPLEAHVPLPGGLTVNDPRPLDDEVRWNVRQRFVFLERRIFWEGTLKRSDLSERFAISLAQASADIERYNDLFPNSVTYDKSAKVFIPGRGFSPRLFEPDARQYLTQLLLMADDALDPKDTWLGSIPPHDAVRRVRRKMDVSTLRAILMAMHTGMDIMIRYQSMSSPEARSRWIAPHALGFDGSRWHVRAWCFEKSMFNDFVVARVLAIEDKRQTVVDPSLDSEWQTFTKLRIGPHPGLSEAQKQVIERDFGMQDGEIAIEMRLSLAWYFERNLCLDLECEYGLELDPRRVQLTLLNREELEALRDKHSPRRRT